MSFLAGHQLRSGALAGAVGGVFRAQNPHFSPTRLHEDPPYLRRKKRPKPGESNFCELCDDKGIALRNADRARRERIRQARKLRARGLTISEIAKKVGARELSTVRRWIG